MTLYPKMKNLIMATQKVTHFRYKGGGDEFNAKNYILFGL